VAVTTEGKYRGKMIALKAGRGFVGLGILMERRSV